MKWTLADAHGLDDVLIALSEGREVYAPAGAHNGSLKLSRAENWRTGFHTLGNFRTTEPLKALFFPAREFIGRWGDAEGREPLPERVVFGVKNCDLSSLAVFDYVFLQGVAPDPYYAEAREKTLLVSADCADHLEVCFCPAVDEQPWPKAGYDINVAQTPSGFVIEEGSARGSNALKSAYALLEPAGDELLAELSERRQAHYEELTEACGQHGLTPGTDLQAVVEASFESGLWADFAEDCVECGACNFICCTCHCFLLADGHDACGTPVRSKLWDACLYDGFARTAGGGSPRPWRAERLRNRFDKKFSFFPKVLGRYACDGCGRCTEACIAKIDIRDVLKRAVGETTP
ncbi:MAG: 4Fe-4S dicluster domain-containing protein [Xanthomonadales bacterium]|nr:4Fe-4S dicluster domain-containing protein [Xanthomonadales bacterium]